MTGFILKLKNFMAPFYGWGSTASRLQSHFKEAVYFIPISSQKFLICNFTDLERMKG